LHVTLLRLRVAGAALLLAACGGGGGGNGGVVNPPPTQVLDNVSVTPATVTLAAGQSQALTASGRTSGGATITTTTFAFSSSNNAVATVSAGGSITALTAGTATITVTGTHNGVNKNATVNVTVTGALPNAATVVAGATTNDFTPANVGIARGGTVTWTFGALLHNVDFQGASGAPAAIGNTENASVARTFANAGTFNYVCTLHSGMNGSVFVP